MRNILLSAAVAVSAATIPATAQAQRAGIIVVDTERVMSECTACRAAQAQLQQQLQAAQQLQTSLTQPLQPERQAIEQAVRALGNKEPDAALQRRIEQYQQRENNVRQQLAQREQTLRSTQAHVQQQLGNRLVQIVEQVRARRGAAIALSKNATLANDNSVEVTADVLAALNQQLPSVSVTPLPQQQQQQQQQQQPQGR